MVTSYGYRMFKVISMDALFLINERTVFQKTNIVVIPIGYNLHCHYHTVGGCLQCRFRCLCIGAGPVVRAALLRVV
jgi:hypothetical protein